MILKEASCIIELPEFADARGKLAVCEFGVGLPFEVKRSFFVYGVPEQAERGKHAHKTCHEFIICVRGSMKAYVDDGKKRTEYFLNRPSHGLYIPPMIWCGQFDHSTDALLVAFASHHYNNHDYIRDYPTFLRVVAERQ